MTLKKIILLIILLGIGIAAWYGYKEFNRKNKDLSKASPDYSLEAATLIREYENDDSAAARKYNGKIIEVNGFVKKIDMDEMGFYTIVLGDTSSLSAVRCSMDTTHNGDAAKIPTGSSAKVRGFCTGFNKDEMGLGSDVILNRCAIIKN